MNARQWREAVADALDELSEDWSTSPGPLDAVQPPMFVIQHGPDPWRERGGVCFDSANLTVLVIAGRIQPDAAFDLLDDMCDAAAVALQGAGFRHQQMLAPTGIEYGGIAYLAVRILLTQPVQFGEDT